MRTVRYRPRAAFDLESIVIHLGEVCQNPALARSTYSSIVEAIQTLAQMPTMGRPFIDETITSRAYRSWLVGNYRVFYSFDAESLTVWRVIHNRQEIDDYAFVEWREED